MTASVVHKAHTWSYTSHGELSNVIVEWIGTGACTHFPIEYEINCVGQISSSIPFFCPT
jgi:hypothetical protein